MKCISCKDGKLVVREVDDTVEIPGGLTLIVKGLPARVCDNCDDVVMNLNTTAERTRRILSALILRYGKRTNEIPGLTADWMRKQIGMTREAFSSYTGKDSSTLAKAAKRKANLDPFSALVLLYLTSDFVTGSHQGKKRLEELFQVEDLIEEKLGESVQFSSMEQLAT